MKQALRLVGVFLFLFVATALAGGQCGPWTVIPGPPAQGIRAAVWTGDRFVAVGGGFWLSPDGRSWRAVPEEGFPPGGDAWLSWAGVASNGRQLVAVADHGWQIPSGGTGAIAVSERGERWELVEPRTAHSLHAVAWGGGRWVAAGDAAFLWSEDGRTWRQGTVISGPEGAAIWSLTHTEHGWIGAGTAADGQSGVLATSEDGVAWTVELVAEPLYTVTSNGARIVAAGSGTALTSEDGTSWAPSELPLHAEVVSMVWDGARFVGAGVVSGWERTDPVVLESNDGNEWTVAAGGNDPAMPLVARLVQGPGVLLGLTFEAGALTSPDGTSWTPAGGAVVRREVRALQPAAGGLLGLAIDTVPDPNPMAVTARTDLIRSADGVHWSHETIGEARFQGLAWRDGRYVATSSSRGLMTSADGLTWTEVSQGLPAHPEPVAVAAGTPGFVASLIDGLYFSADGLAWQRGSSKDGRTLPLRSVAWAGDRFLAAGEDRVATSTDGLQWTVTEGAWGTGGFFSFAGRVGRYVGIGPGGLLAWSGDGLSWNTVSGLPDGELFSVTWDGQEFLVAGAGFVLRSTDGVEWSSEAVPDTPWFGGVAVLDGRTVIAGRDGSLLVRGCPGETLDQGGAFRMALPAMAHTPGRNGTLWRSGLVLHNPGSEAVQVSMWPLGPSGADDGVAAASVVAPPGQDVVLQDLLPGLLGSDAPSGGAILSADGPMLAASRTFTVDGGGAWGQNVPLVPESAWVEAGRPVVLAGLAQDAATRTNLGLLNPGGSSLTVDVRFHGADGAVLGERSWTAPARGWRQIDLALEEAGAAPVPLAWAELDGDGDFVAYASVIDNASGDAVTVLPAGSSGGDLVVPAAAHVTGYGGVLWRTDLDLVSGGNGPARYRLELLPASGEPIESAERTLAAGHAERLADVVGTVFGAQGAGAIRVSVLEGELVAASRTYAVGAAGSFGQAVPAVAVDGGSSGGEALRLTGLSGSLADDTGFRTDIGAVNLSDQPVSLDIELHAGDGTVIGHRQLDLGAGRWGQLDRVFRGLAATPVVGGYAVLTSDGDLSQVRAYASVIDNRTGDPVYLPAVAAEP